MASFVPSFFPLDVLDEIWDLIESLSEGFLTYSYNYRDMFLNYRDSFLAISWQKYATILLLLLLLLLLLNGILF